MPYSIKIRTVEEARILQLKAQHSYNYRHRKTVRAKNREWGRTHKSIRRAYAFKSLYGITIAFYESECKRLGNICQICAVQTKLVVDHNHKTKKFRGLLCRKCNVAIGLLGDDRWTIQSALNYITEVQRVQNIQLAS